MNNRITNKERGMILGCLKRTFSRSGLAQRIRNAKASKEKGPKGGRRFVCDHCANTFDSSGINVDHIEPVIPIGVSFVDLTLEEVIDRLWCNEDNLQILCKECHALKSKAETKERKRIRKQKKTNEA